MRIRAEWFTILLSVLMLSVVSQAVERRDQDIKLPTQAVLERQAMTAVAAASATTILNGVDGPSSAAAATVTTFSGQPSVPRNLTVTPGGTTTDVENCVVTITGTDARNAVISEAFTFSADASSAQVGSKAFKTVTSVAWAASCESGGYAATWSVGQGSKLGLKHCMTGAGDYAWGSFGGAYEATRATVAANATAVSGNTVQLNSALNGSDLVLYYVQNFRCL